MSAPELYIHGKRLDVAKRIGKGGEGEVYLLSEENKKAVKIYYLKNSARESKVREQDQRDRILDGAQSIMATYGRAAIRLHDFALGMRMAPATIRRSFPDMDYLLAEILYRHLRAIVAELAKIPFDTPNRNQLRRATYLAVTRTHGAPTEAHLLLIRDRHLLPPDEAEPLEAMRLSIGDIVAGEHAKAALALLDSPELTPEEIETSLAALIHPPAAKPRLIHPQNPKMAAGAPGVSAPLPWPAAAPPTPPDKHAQSGHH